MATLTTKTKYINIVVRKKDLDITTRDNLIKEWCDINTVNYAYIYHKEDYNLEGIKEEPHLHLVAVLGSSKRLSTVLNQFVSCVGLTTLGVMIDKCISIEGSIQYLLHKNDINKTPHSINEIITNYPHEELKLIINTDIVTLTPQRLYDIVLHSKNNYDIISALGVGRYCQLRNVIKDIQEDLGIKKARFKSAVKES